MDPREVITDKDVYRAGDSISVKVKCVCAVVDTGYVDFRVYRSSDRETWEVLYEKTTFLACPLGGGYVVVDCDPVTVTQDMVGTLYIGVCNRWDPLGCPDIILSSSSPNAIVTNKMLTVKNQYPPGFGGLTVITNPSAASLEIDNQALGSTPLYDIELPAGAHTIRISKQGYTTIEEQAFVTAGSQNIKNYTLINDCVGWWCPIVDYIPYIIGGAAGVAALVIIMKARQKRAEMMRE